MRPRPTPLFLSVQGGFVFLGLLLSLVLTASLARSSQPSPPPAPLDLTDQVRKYDESAVHRIPGAYARALRFYSELNLTWVDANQAGSRAHGVESRAELFNHVGPWHSPSRSYFPLPQQHPPSNPSGRACVRYHIKREVVYVYIEGASD